MIPSIVATERCAILDGVAVVVELWSLNAGLPRLAFDYVPDTPQWTQSLA